MTFQKFIQKSCNNLGLMAPNRYELDLSNEVLIIHFGQGAVKISEVKVVGRKKLPGIGASVLKPADLATSFLTSNFDC